MFFFLARGGFPITQQTRANSSTAEFFRQIVGVGGRGSRCRSQFKGLVRGTQDEVDVLYGIKCKAEGESVEAAAQKRQNHCAQGYTSAKLESPQWHYGFSLNISHKVSYRYFIEIILVVFVYPWFALWDSWAICIWHTFLCAAVCVFVSLLFCEPCVLYTQLC